MASGALRCCRKEDWKRVEIFLAAVVSGRKSLNLIMMGEVLKDINYLLLLADSQFFKVFRDFQIRSCFKVLETHLFHRVTE